MASSNDKEPIRRNRKLTKAKATMIRKMYADGKVSMRELATLYGVSTSAINQVLQNITFRDENTQGFIIKKKYILIERS